MNLILLRGQVPTDRGKGGWKEITYPNITQCMDFYTLLAYEMTRGRDDWCEVVYWGRERKKFIDYNAWELWVKRLRDYKPSREPTVIFARGGFPEYHRVLKRYPNAYKIYYGAGKRFLPQEGFTDYNLILVDSLRQMGIVQEEHPYIDCKIWQKPPPPQFKPLKDVKKKYDVCYVAVHPEDPRKRCRWVYETCPKHLKVLQLGYAPKGGAPDNFKVRYLQRSQIPKAMNKCKVGIVPYTKDDSGPRAMYEMLACNLPVVALDGLQLPQNLHPRLEITTKSEFWENVSRETKSAPYNRQYAPMPISALAKMLRHDIEER